MRRAMNCWLLCLVAGLVGCGGADRPKLVQVTGQVTLNGKPLEGAMVAMKLVGGDQAKYGRPSRATTDAQGNFTPATYGDAAGIPTGTYEVAVIKQEIPDGYNAENPASTSVNIKWITPKNYSEPATSGLKVEVKADGMSPAVIALESDGKMQVENTKVKPKANDP